MTNMNEENRNYWEEFYNNGKLGLEDIPSQFAAFVLSEFPKRKTILDIGCGNGRDTFFFARHVSKVIGIDASESAISYCNKKRNIMEVDNAFFYCLDVSSIDGGLELLEGFSSGLEDSVLYARFFLHAINEETEKSFLDLASFASRRGGAVAVEFRTHRDEQQKKETSEHFRRYINPLQFMDKARSVGLSLSYFTEGFGLAKYKGDDAHVARFLFQ